MSGKNVKKSNKNIMIAAVVAVVLIVTAIIVVAIVMGGNKDKDVVIGAANNYEESGHITLGDYKGVKVDLNVTDDEVSAEIESILEDEEVFVENEGVPVEGDTVNFTYIASVDGNVLEDYSEEDVFMLVGDEEYYSEFDKEVLTMNTGDTKTIDIPFEEEYGDELVDGKTVSFELTLNYIAGEAIKQELTDEFATKYTEGECTTADAFDEYIKESLYQDNVDYCADTAWEIVIENTEVDKYHKGEVKIAKEEEIKRYETFSEVTGEDILEAFDMTEEDVEDIAKEVAKERMIAKTIASKENLVMSDEDYKNMLVDFLKEEDEETDVTAMSIEELEDYYFEMYQDNAKEAMFLEYVKKYVVDNAEVIGLK